MIRLSVPGFAAFNTLQYWAWNHPGSESRALQAAAPRWSRSGRAAARRAARRGRLSGAAVAAGVLVILLHGDLTRAANMNSHTGDLIFHVALMIFPRAVFGGYAETPEHSWPFFRLLYLRCVRRA